MLMWSGLFAKVVEFIANKLIGKKIDLAMDKKSRAAKAFLQLHNSFVEVDKTLGKVIDVFTEGCKNKKHIVLSKKFMELVPEIDSCSKDFLIALSRTMYSIEIIDPNLAIMLAGIRSRKLGYLLLRSFYNASQLNVDFERLHPFKKISYTALDESLSGLNIDEYYSRISDRESARKVHEELRDVIEHGILKGEIKPKDFKKICFFSKELRRHREKLGEARELLRMFISTAFSIEDLLFY